jgi:hypothetical protein
MEELESGELVKLLQLLLQKGCPHRFSWPRVDDNGRHYQVCLACGTAYEYDWEMMRRTNRMLVMAVQTELHRSSVVSH